MTAVLMQDYQRFMQRDARPPNADEASFMDEK